MSKFLVFLMVLCAIPVDARDAPPLTFTVPGRGATTLEQLRDHVLVLEFGYATCKPCQALAERLDRIATEFRGRGLQAFEILFDPNAPQLVPALTRDQKLSIPIAWTTGQGAMRFLGYAPADRPVVPQVVVIDADGKIRYQTAAQGSDALRTDTGLRARITELLTPSSSSGTRSTKSSR